MSKQQGEQQGKENQGQQQQGGQGPGRNQDTQAEDYYDPQDVQDLGPFDEPEQPADEIGQQGAKELTQGQQQGGRDKPGGQQRG